MYLFLDDERMPNDERAVIVRSFDEFRDHIIAHGMPKFISFDHDLGHGLTGFDCAKWLVEYHLDNGGDFPHYHVHSQNPIGKKNIEEYLKGYLLAIRMP